MRHAILAGQFYEKEGSRLTSQLKKFFCDIKLNDESISKQVKGMIAPHAGYLFSGKCAAYAYCEIKNNNFKKIFILGTNHGCQETCVTQEDFETPLGLVKTDKTITKQLNL